MGHFEDPADISVGQVHAHRGLAHITRTSPGWRFLLQLSSSSVCMSMILERIPHMHFDKLVPADLDGLTIPQPGTRLEGRYRKTLDPIAWNPYNWVAEVNKDRPYLRA